MMWTYFCENPDSAGRPRKSAGALAAVPGGLDTFDFTSGIGENSAVIRARICAKLEVLGVHLDQDLNNESTPVTSRKSSPVAVRVIKNKE